MFPFRFLAFVTARVCFAEDRREGLRQPGSELFVVGDVEAGVERLARESAVGVAGSGVGMVCVGEQPQAVMEECASAGVVLVVFREPPAHVSEAGADAVLVAFQGAVVACDSDLDLSHWEMAWAPAGGPLTPHRHVQAIV